MWAPRSSAGNLLVYYVDPGEAAAMRSRLRAAGVMVEIDSVDPHNIQPSKSGTQRVGLWVTIDDQFDDAVKLLQDPSHLPRRVVSQREMEAISGGDSMPRRIGKLALVAGTICLLAGMVYLALL